MNQRCRVEDAVGADQPFRDLDAGRNSSSGRARRCRGPAPACRASSSSASRSGNTPPDCSGEVAEREPAPPALGQAGHAGDMPGKADARRPSLAGCATPGPARSGAPRTGICPRSEWCCALGAAWSFCHQFGPERPFGQRGFVHDEFMTRRRDDLGLTDPALGGRAIVRHGRRGGRHADDVGTARTTLYQRGPCVELRRDRDEVIVPNAPRRTSASFEVQFRALHKNSALPPDDRPFIFAYMNQMGSRPSSCIVPPAHMSTFCKAASPYRALDGDLPVRGRDHASRTRFWARRAARSGRAS